jgi:hypothetical protein
MQTLFLKYVDNDSWDRPVYKHQGRLYVDVSPRKNFKPEIFTKTNNDFDGEPDYPLSQDIPVLFEPERITW